MVRTRGGGHDRGGAELTPFGLRLIAHHEMILARASASAAPELDALRREMRASAPR